MESRLQPDFCTRGAGHGAQVIAVQGGHRQAEHRRQQKNVKVGATLLIKLGMIYVGYNPQ